MICLVVLQKGTPMKDKLKKFITNKGSVILSLSILLFSLMIVSELAQINHHSYWDVFGNFGYKIHDLFEFIDNLNKG